MAEITRKLATNTRRQFLFVVINTASTRCLCENFQLPLICYSQQVNATWRCDESGSSSFSKWPNDRIVAEVKPCWLLAQGRRNCRERRLKSTFGWVFKKIWTCSISRKVIVMT